MKLGMPIVGKLCHRRIVAAIVSAILSNRSFGMYMWRRIAGLIPDFQCRIQNPLSKTAQSDPIATSNVRPVNRPCGLCNFQWAARGSRLGGLARLRLASCFVDGARTGSFTWSRGGARQSSGIGDDRRPVGQSRSKPAPSAEKAVFKVATVYSGDRLGGMAGGRSFSPEAWVLFLKIDFSFGPSRDPVAG
jgi:hypothetical protein